MIEWVLKSSLWLTLFWILWRFLLSRETFHRFNRWYLGAMLALSLLMPAIQLHYVREAAPVISAMQANVTEMPATTEPVSDFKWIALVLAAYAAGVAIAAAGTIWQGIGVRRSIRKHGYTQYDGYRVVEIDGSTPFSVGRYIFLDPALPEIERGVVIAHEMAHIRGRHGFALLLADVVRIVQWFNPFARLAVRAVRDNHEFLADAAVLAEGYSPATYKAVLVNCTLGSRVFTLGHTFAEKNNLNRYVMMNKKNSDNARKLTVLAIIPVAAAILAAFATPRYVTSDNSQLNPVVEMLNSEEGLPLLIIDGQELPFDRLTNIDESKVDIITLVKGQEAIDKYGERAEHGAILVGTKEYASKQPVFLIDGKISSTQEVIDLDTDRVENITLLKDTSAFYKYSEYSNKAGVVIIETNKS